MHNGLKAAFFWKGKIGADGQVEGENLNVSREGSMKTGVTLRLHRYLQDAGCCAIAAAASVANYYDKNLDYEVAKGIVDPDGQGMYTPDIGRLMNTLGFNAVTIVSANMDCFDFKWQGLSRNRMLNEIKRVARYGRDEESKEIGRAYVNFLSDTAYKNDVIIDINFGKYIREHLSQGKPVLASFCWNLFFNYPKWNDQGEIDPLRGQAEEHEVVIYGYDEKGVHILDSHHELYRGKLKKYASGRYTMSWELLMTVMGSGDLVLPDKFVSPSIESLVPAEH
jgi:predicted double-glycine peptidase